MHRRIGIPQSIHTMGPTGRSSHLEQLSKQVKGEDIDSLQFHIDGLYSSKSSVQIKRNCAWGLLMYCNAQNINCFSAGRERVAAKLFDVVELVGNEIDLEIKIALLSLALTLICDRENFETPGKFVNPTLLPCNVFCAIVRSLLQLQSCDASAPRNPAQSHPAEQSVVESSAAKAGGFHAKRKLSKTSSTSSRPSPSAPLFDSQSTCSQSSTETYPLNDTQSSTHQQQTGSSGKLSGLWPELTALLAMNRDCRGEVSGSVPTIADTELVLGLNLLLLNRIMHSMVLRVVSGEAALMKASLDEDEGEEAAFLEPEESCEDGEPSSKVQLSAELKRNKALLASMQDSFRLICKSSAHITARKLGSELLELVPQDCFAYELCRILVAAFGEAKANENLDEIQYNRKQLHIWLVLSIIEFACHSHSNNQGLFVRHRVASPDNRDDMDSSISLITRILQFVPIAMRGTSSVLLNGMDAFAGHTSDDISDNVGKIMLPQYLFQELQLGRSIGDQRLLSAALNVLVCLTDKCEYTMNAVCDQFCINGMDAPSGRKRLKGASSPFQLSTESDAESSFDVLDMMYNLLRWCSEWRKSLCVGPDSSASAARTSIGALLSPDENMTERLMFDLEILIISLLANIVDACAFGSLKKKGYRVRGIPAIFATMPATVEHKLEPLMSSIDDHLWVGNDGYREGYYDICTLLAQLLQMETLSFIDDIEKTDRYFVENDQQPTICPEAAQSSVTEYTTENETAQAMLPIAELILSAQLAIALHTVVLRMFGQSNSESVKQYLSRLGLPRGSWWLPCRVLKAFVAIQGQTGVVFVESIETAVKAIAHMDHSDK